MVLVFQLRLSHFESRLAQDVSDSIALRRSQLQIATNALHDRLSGHADNPVAVGKRADRKAHQQSRNADQDAEPKIRSSWQSRSLSPVFPAPADRLLLRNWRVLQASTDPPPVSGAALSQNKMRRCWT